MAQVETRILVKQAADALLAEGIRPTVINVRARTGRGSAGTINTALQEWWQTLAKRLAQVETRPEIPEPVFAVAEQLWDAALRQAEAALAKESEKLKHAQEAAAVEVETARRAQRAAEERAVGLAQRLEVAEQIRLELERGLAGKTAQKDHLDTQLNGVREVLSQKEQFLRDQIKRHEAQLERERGQLASLEQRLVAQLDEQKTARERLEKLLQHRDNQWREREETLQRQWQAASNEAAQIQVRLKLLEENLQEAKREAQRLRQAREKEAADMATLRGERNQAISEKKHWQAQTVELCRQIKVLDAQQKSSSNQLRRSEMQLTACRGEIRLLQALLDRLMPVLEQEGVSVQK